MGFFEANGENTYFVVYLSEQAEVNGPIAQEIAFGIIRKCFSCN